LTAAVLEIKELRTKAESDREEAVQNQLRLFEELLARRLKEKEAEISDLKKGWRAEKLTLRVVRTDVLSVG